MNPQEIKALKTLCESTQESFTLHFTTLGDEISDTIGAALNTIAEKASCIQVRTKKDTDQTEPFILIRDNIRLKARPFEKIFYLFIEIIDAVLHPERHIKGLELKDVVAPVFLKVYIAPFCPYCPSVVKEMVKLALLSDQIRLEIIDGTLFTDRATNDGIMAAPTVICDGKHRWSGIVSASEILDVVCKRKPEDLSPDTLKAMVEAGNATLLANLMITENKVFPAVYDLLTHEKWPVRLGAMVVVETLHERAAHLSGNIIDTLWERYPRMTDPVKGDIIYLTGEVAGESYRKRLETLSHGNLTDDLKEAVNEALESLLQRSGSAS